MSDDAAQLPPLLPSAFDNQAWDLEPGEVHERVTRGELILIDIREPEERAESHVPGSRHIPIDRVASRAPFTAVDRPVAFMCRGGVRAGMVTTAFRAAGFEAYNVRGGMVRWAASGLPVEPHGARVAEH